MPAEDVAAVRPGENVVVAPPGGDVVKLFSSLLTIRMKYMFIPVRPYTSLMCTGNNRSPPIRSHSVRLAPALLSNMRLGCKSQKAMHTKLICVLDIINRYKK
jgi:hypothetical protein